jgi:hypothetical protein
MYVNNNKFKEASRQATIKRNKSPEMKKISGDRLRNWNTSNIEICIARGSKALIKSFQNPEFLIKHKERSSIQMVEWNRKWPGNRGSWVKYKGINFRSTWERAFVKQCDSNNIIWFYE